MSSSLNFAPALALHTLRFPAFPDTHAMESQPAVSEYLPQVRLLMAVTSGTHNAPARNRRALEHVFTGEETDSERFSYLPKATVTQAKALPKLALWLWVRCGASPASVAIFKAGK